MNAGLFQRPEANYVVDDAVIGDILRDPAQPLARMAALIPDGARVLDIGAGNGNLARVLARAGRSLAMDGIEPNVFAAHLARPHYRTMHTAFAQDLIAAGALGDYDFLVLADVIEHTSDPFAFLKGLHPLVVGGARVLLSVPHIGFGAARLGLLNGAFDYVDSGLLERTHLRFFTLKTARALFADLGWGVEKVLRLQRSFTRVEYDRAVLKAPASVLRQLAADEEARTYQYLFVLSGDAGVTPVFEQHGATEAQVLRDLGVGRAMARLRRLVGAGGR